MSSVNLYKYSGAGNDFVVLDGRNHANVQSYREAATIAAICDRKSGFKAADGRIGADGLMILSDSEQFDFAMEYYNSDGSGGMMCGNGGRCIVAFADHQGVRPADGKILRFEAADGIHTGEIISRNGSKAIVRIGMVNAFDYREVLDGCYLNTGTRHFVKFVDDVEAMDISVEGPRYRHDPEFAPIGANANFVEILPDGSLKVRTFEKGVEDETLACGTGITACAIAAGIRGIDPARKDGRTVFFDLHARIDDLSVDFVPGDPVSEFAATEVFLTGPAELI